MLSTTSKTRMTLLKASQLSENQQAGVTRLFEHDHTMLIAKMGSGKTIVALTAMLELLDAEAVGRVLIIAPLKVANTVWQQERDKWAHLKSLSINVATGSEANRINAIETDSDVVVINFENVDWFFSRYGNNHNFDGLVVDELTRLKSPSSKAFKKLRRRLNDFVWRVGMTGTPVSENFESMYSQALVVDNGKALGTRHDMFLQTYFFPTDYEQRNWELRVEGAEAIVNRLKPIVFTLEDYRAELPPITYYTEKITLPDDTRAYYNAFKRDAIIEIKGREIVAVNEAVATGKLAQLSCGFVYDTETGDYARLNKVRIQRIKKLVAKAKTPVLIAYWFKPDLELIKEAFDCPVIGAGASKKKVNEAVEDWNAGRLNVMAIHPRSAGHGLNLQAGGATVIWYAPQWSRDLWEQTNARLWRRGQTRPVEIITLVAENTVDELIDQRVEDKAEFDRLLHEHLSL